MLRELFGNLGMSTVQLNSRRKSSKSHTARSRRLFLEGLESRQLLATLVVDDDGADCKKADFTSIQAAVAVAKPGDKVEVCDGTYEEQVTIPATKDGLELRSKHKQHAVIQAPPGMDEPGIVHVDGADNVTIRGFTIRGPFTTLPPEASGIFIGGNGSATIRENHITDIRTEPLGGAQTGIGIQVGSTELGQSGSAIIQKNLIDDYQKGGIEVDNNSSAVIEDNEVIGAGPTTAIAQNGIQITGNSTATVRKNHVTGNYYLPAGGVTATGILVNANTTNVNIEKNDVEDNELGIAVQNASEVTIQKNKVDGNDLGIFATNATDIAILDNDIANNSGTGILLNNVTLSLLANNKIKNNGSHGINLQGGSNDNDIRNNKIDGNGGSGIRISNSHRNRVDKNHSSKNGESGIRVVNNSSENKITDNQLKDNASFDAFDNTTGARTAGTANFWEGNKGKTQNRPGLLKN